MRSVCPHIMVMGGPCEHEKHLPSYHGYGVLVDMRSVCPHIMVMRSVCPHIMVMGVLVDMKSICPHIMEMGVLVDMRSICPHIMVMGGPCGHEKHFALISWLWRGPCGICWHA